MIPLQTPGWAHAVPCRLYCTKQYKNSGLDTVVHAKYCCLFELSETTSGSTKEFMCLGRDLFSGQMNQFDLGNLFETIIISAVPLDAASYMEMKHYL